MRLSALCVLAGVGGVAAVAHVERQVTGLPLPSATTSSISTTSSTSTGTDPSSTSQPDLAFSKPVNLITCTTGSISWDYSGPDITIKLTAEVATNVSPTPGALAERSLPPFRIGLGGAGANVAKRQVVGTTTTLGTGISAQSQQFQWNPVNVPAGTYILVASTEDPAYNVESSSDRFQIVNGTNVACLSSTSSTSSASSTATSSSSSSGSSATAVPVSTAGRANAGAIAGGVIGGLVLLIGLAAALFLFYRRAQSPTRPRDAWGALKSDPAHGGAGGGSRYGAQDLGPGPSVGGVASDESLPNEKVFAHPYAAPAAALPYVASAGAGEQRPRSHKRNSTQSSLHYTTREHSDVNPFAAPGAIVHPPTPTSPVYGLPTPTPTSAGYPSSAGASAGHSSGEMIPMQRSPSTGNGAGSARRTARKPVPNYVPQDAAPSPSPTPSSNSHLPPGDVPELTHKSSFGPGTEGRPVHYLIPDMPADESE